MRQCRPVGGSYTDPQSVIVGELRLATRLRNRLKDDHRIDCAIVEAKDQAQLWNRLANICDRYPSLKIAVILSDNILKPADAIRLSQGIIRNVLCVVPENDKETESLSRLYNAPCLSMEEGGWFDRIGVSIRNTLGSAAPRKTFSMAGLMTSDPDPEETLPIFKNLTNFT